jgi:hypothetical protein
MQFKTKKYYQMLSKSIVSIIFLYAPEARRGIHPGPDSPAPRKCPPIVIIMAVQLRYDARGEWMPNINLLKAEGVSFDRTLSQ